MNGPCRNGNCPKLANLTARWSGVGDRAFCRGCFDSLKALVGDDLRELPAETVVPEWRQRSLRRVFGEQVA